MRDYEVRLTKSGGSGLWSLDIYDPNIAVVVESAEKNFNTIGEAECWLDIWGHDVTTKLDYIVRAEVSHDTNLAELLK